MRSEPASSSVAPAFPFGQPVVWRPDAESVEKTNLWRFMNRHGIADLNELIERANADVAWFWDAVMEDLDIEFTTPYSNILELPDGPAFPKWCVGGEMNIVHNLIDKWKSTDVWDSVAVKWEGEDGETRYWTYSRLDEEVRRCASALSELGVGNGDAVGLFMPMTPELVAAFLAIIKIGGIALPLFSGYGPSALITRLKDAGAKALFTADGFYRRGEKIPMKPVADEAAEHVSTIAHIVALKHVGIENVSMTPGRDLWWSDLVANSRPDAETCITSAEDVCMILYTSGTTGSPKGAVHTHCGFPVKGAQDMFHCMDLKRGETMYWMSDMGWMMGPWLVFGTLAIGASMVLYDGAPDFPDVDRLWDLVERHNVSHLGLSPVLIRALMAHGTTPVQKHDVSGLRMVGSTGSPWDPESWNWLFKNVLESRKPIINYSGGTEISGGILCGNFLTPLKPAAFSGPVPGMDVDVVDADGRSVRGEVGELVIRQPWIGMTRGFWGATQRYLDTYWSRFENIWLHGDFAAVDADGLWYILGRSDDTIKVAGKRLGPAEVESILNAHPDVTESAAIGVPDERKGETLVVFCVLKPTKPGTESLRVQLSDLITDQLGKPLKPREIHFALSLPKTRNAKVMRRVIRAVYLNEDPGDVSSLEDPETLEEIKKAIDR